MYSAHNFHLKKCIYQLFLEFADRNLTSGLFQNLSQSNIREHNIMEIYNYNLNQLREFKEKTGTGILHFKNPLQLLDRLELLSGSILAGNNGVMREFSQIAHLLNQMKVITKKQLNDLLKKYILNK